MASKKRKAKDLGKDMSDEYAGALLNCEKPLFLTKKILKDKPHFGPSKFEDIPAAMNEMKELCLTLTDAILKDLEGSEKDKTAVLLCALCNFVHTVLQFREFFDLIHVNRIVHHLAGFLFCDIPSKVKNQISILCERYVEISIIEEHQKVAQCLLNYILDLTLSTTSTVKKIDLKRLWTLRRFIDIMDIGDPEWEILVRKYMSTVTNKTFIQTKEGNHVIGYIMRKSPSYAKKVHDVVVKAIPKLTKQLSAGYGQAYFVAWTTADDEMQKFIEQECIQDIMMKVINIPRSGLEMPKAGANGFAMLSFLHGCRKLRNFSHVLNNLWTPLLWRFLRDSDPWKRCNAAQLFFDVFPLENPFSSAADLALYVERQVKEMKDLLMDDSHFVRILAIRGVCHCLVHSIELFNVEQYKTFMEILTLDLTHDGSSHLVRKAVFEAFENMIRDSVVAEDEEYNDNSQIKLLQGVLPSISRSLFDTNEKVRKAYVKMLLKLNERSKDFNSRYWQVNSMREIIVRLAYEGPVVGPLLSKLIIGQLISTSNGLDKMIQRICKASEYSFDGIKNVFKYSKKAMSVDSAYRLIIALIGTIRKALKDYLDSVNSSNESVTIQPKKPKKKGKTRRLEDIEEDDEPNENDENCGVRRKVVCKRKKEETDKSADLDSTVTSTTSSAVPDRKVEEEFLGHHKHVRVLIQIATVVWVVFRAELSEKTEYLNNLYSLASNSIPMFLQFYKGTPVYYATVSFSSLIPIAQLRPVSTISSACVSELKEVTPTTDLSQLQCLLYALCSWNRGHDVLDLASEWINFAFREQNLNNTATAKKSGHKVRFLQNSGKPLLALKLLDVLFSDVINEQRILNKNYEQLHDFYTFLERVLARSHGDTEYMTFHVVTLLDTLCHSNKWLCVQTVFTQCPKLHLMTACQEIIIERKMAGDEGFDKPGSTLTNEFLGQAFQRYMRLMHSLHQEKKSTQDNQVSSPSDLPPVSFDAAETTLKTIYWATNILCPKIPLEEKNDDEIPLAVDCCRTILRETALAVELEETNQAHCQALCLFTKDLLSLDCSWFIDDAFYAIKVIGEYAEAYTPKDEWHLISDVLPSLHEKALSVMTKIDVSPATLKTIVKSMPKFKASIFSLPAIFQRRHGWDSPQFKDIYRNLIHTCVLLVQQEIQFEDRVLTYSKFEELPCFATVILKTVLINTYFAKNLLPTLRDFLEMFSRNYEDNALLSCVSILYTLVVAGKRRFAAGDLESLVPFMYDVISQYQPKPVPVKEDSFSDCSFHINVQKAALPVVVEIGKVLNCAVYQPFQSGEWPAENNEVPEEAAPSKTPSETAETSPEAPVQADQMLDRAAVSARSRSASPKNSRPTSAMKATSKKNKTELQTEGKTTLGLGERLEAKRSSRKKNQASKKLLLNSDSESNSDSDPDPELENKQANSSSKGDLSDFSAHKSSSDSMEESEDSEPEAVPETKKNQASKKEKASRKSVGSPETHSDSEIHSYSGDEIHQKQKKKRQTTSQPKKIGEEIQKSLSSSNVDSSEINTDSVTQRENPVKPDKRRQAKSMKTKQAKKPELTREIDSNSEKETP